MLASPAYVDHHHLIRTIPTNMDTEQLKDIIRQEIQNVAFVAVQDNDALLDQNILDSVGAVDLAVALEGSFGISIPFVDINKQQFHSVDTLAEYLRKKLAVTDRDAGK